MTLDEVKAHFEACIERSTQDVGSKGLGARSFAQALFEDIYLGAKVHVQVEALAVVKDGHGFRIRSAPLGSCCDDSPTVDLRFDEVPEEDRTSGVSRCKIWVKGRTVSLLSRKALDKFIPRLTECCLRTLNLLSLVHWADLAAHLQVHTDEIIVLNEPVDVRLASLLDSLDSLNELPRWQGTDRRLANQLESAASQFALEVAVADPAIQPALAEQLRRLVPHLRVQEAALLSAIAGAGFVSLGVPPGDLQPPAPAQNPPLNQGVTPPVPEATPAPEAEASPGQAPHPAPIAPETIDHNLLWWLAWWGQIHERIRQAAAAETPQQPDRWPELSAAAALVPRSASLLSALLPQLFQGAHSALPERAATVHSRLRLWLLWRMAPTVAAWMGREASRLRAHHRRGLEAYAWLMRESLRELYCGHRGTYRFSPDRLRAALCEVVSMHALKVVELDPALLIGQYLEQLGRGEGPARDYHQQAGQTQHTLEVYLAGHFILDTHVADAPTSPTGLRTVADLVVALQPEALPERRSALRKAFSLAALFHDHASRALGGLRLPELPGTPASTQAIFRKVQEDHGRALVELIDHARAGVEAQDLFLPSLQRDRLRAWLAALGPQDRGAHDLLSAWSLIERTRDHRLSAEGEATLKAALRAILLHEAPGVPIDGREDPAALVLVLADTLFDWELTRNTSTTYTYNPGLLAGDLPAFRARARDVSWERRTWVHGQPPGYGTHAEDNDTGTDIKESARARDPSLPRLTFTVELRSDAIDAGLACADWLVAIQNLTRVDARIPNGSDRGVALFGVQFKHRQPATGPTSWLSLDRAKEALRHPTQGALIELFRVVEVNQSAEAATAGPSPGSSLRYVPPRAKGDPETLIIPLDGQMIWTRDIRPGLKALKEALGHIRR